MAELLFATQIQHSGACEGRNAVLNVQEHECAEGLQHNRGQGFAEPPTCLGCDQCPLPFSIKLHLAAVFISLYGKNH